MLDIMLTVHIHFCVLFRTFTVSKKKNCSHNSSLCLFVFLKPYKQDESAFFFYCEFNTTTWITSPPVFNCPNVQGLICHPWDYSQSSFPSKPTQSSVSLCLRIWSHHFGDVWEAVRSSLPTSFPATDKLVISSLIWDSLLHSSLIKHWSKRTPSEVQV